MSANITQWHEITVLAFRCFDLSADGLNDRNSATEESVSFDSPSVGSG
ncbi:MAG: hypothetical protein WCM76_13475 [Bacteroidota bacterium]